MPGFVIYEGPSLLDGAPIVAIAVTSSSNSKTGNMVQTYILRADVKPTDALKSGADASICGDCKHRPANGGACYVVVMQGPLVVWKHYQKGGYLPDADAAADACRGRMVRLGTYGDPAAVPAYVWMRLLAHAAGHTGYTHQWRSPSNALRDLVMASADTAEEAAEARALGWRTFRVRCADEPMLERESVCPASEEAGKKLTCATCGACNGAASGRRGSIAIIVHGSKAKRFAAQRVQ